MGTGTAALANWWLTSRRVPYHAFRPRRLASEVVTMDGQRACITALLEGGKRDRHTMRQVIDGEAVSAGDWDSIRSSHGTPGPDSQLKVAPASRLLPRPGQAILGLDAEIGGRL
jgi:hypothetical protein